MTEKGFAWITQPGAAALVKVCAFLMPLACILWNLDLPTRLGFAVLTEQYLALVLGLAVCILFLTVSWKRERGHRVGALDICLALLGLGTLVYTAFAYVGLLNEIAFTGVRHDRLLVQSHRRLLQLANRRLRPVNRCTHGKANANTQHVAVDSRQ